MPQLSAVKRLLKLLTLCLIVTLTVSCSRLNLTLPLTTVKSDFCADYTKVIQQTGDSQILAKRTVKERIASNEAKYACICENRDLPICKATQ